MSDMTLDLDTPSSEFVSMAWSNCVFEGPSHLCRATIEALEANAALKLLAGSSDEGSITDALQQLLDCFDRLTLYWQIPRSAKQYRSTFPADVRMCFNSINYDEGYPADLFSAAQDCQRTPLFSVDGHQFAYSSSVLMLARGLTTAYEHLERALTNYSIPQDSGAADITTFNCIEMRRGLSALDTCWARFEESFVGEKHAIEMSARKPVLDVAVADEALRESEIHEQDSTIQTEALRTLLAKLSVVADRGHIKGAEQYSVATLRCAADVQRQTRQKYPQLAQLGENLTEAFDRMRDVLPQYSRAELIQLRVAQNVDLIRELQSFTNAYRQFSDMFRDRYTKLQIEYVRDAVTQALRIGAISLDDIRTDNVSMYQKISRIAAVLEVTSMQTFRKSTLSSSTPTADDVNASGTLSRLFDRRRSSAGSIFGSAETFGSAPSTPTSPSSALRRRSSVFLPTERGATRQTAAFSPDQQVTYVNLPADVSPSAHGARVSALAKAFKYIRDFDAVKVDRLYRYLSGERGADLLNPQVQAAAQHCIRAAELSYSQDSSLWEHIMWQALSTQPQWQKKQVNYAFTTALPMFARGAEPRHR